MSNVCIHFFASSCFPTGETNIPKNASSESEILDSIIPDYIEKELDDNLIVNADVTGAKSRSFKNISISLKEFDQDVVIQTFLSNKEISERHDILDASYKNTIGTSIVCSDGSCLTITPGCILYDDIYYRERIYTDEIFGTEYFIRSDVKQIYKKDNLNSINKNDAVEKIKQLTIAMGINVSDTPEVIALDFDTLINEWENFETKDGDGPRRWEKDDEAYVIVFPVEYDQNNITNTGYLNPGFGTPVIGSRILGVVTKDGLIYFECKGIYEFGEIKKDNISPIGLDTALEQVQRKYQDVLLTHPVIITKAALEYVPVVTPGSNPIKYELVPAWIFSTQQVIEAEGLNGTEKRINTFPIIILAETGQELRIGGKW